MNINSVNGLELYKILFNQESATRFHTSNEDKSSVTSTGINRMRDVLELSTAYKNNIDTTSIISIFETGSASAYGNYTPGSTYGSGGSFDMVSSIGNYFGEYKSKDELAKYFADIGKRLDDAYAEGKFTEDEYNELNKSLDEFMMYASKKHDEGRARREVLKDFKYYAPPVELDKNLKPNEEQQKVLYDTLNNAISDFLTKNGYFDVNKFMDLVNNLRYGNNSSDLVNSMLLK